MKKKLNKLSEDETIEALKLGTIIVCKLNGVAYEKILETLDLIPTMMENKIFFKVGGRDYTMSHVIKLSSMYLYNFTLVIKLYLFEVFNKCVPKDIGKGIRTYDERIDYLLKNIGENRLENAISELVDDAFIEIIHESFEIKNYQLDVLKCIEYIDKMTRNEIIDSCDFIKEQILLDIVNKGEHSEPRPKRTVYQSYVMKSDTIIYKNLKTKKPTGKKL